MKSIIFYSSVVMIVAHLLVTTSLAQEQNFIKKECTGEYVLRKPTSEEISKILERHKEWLNSGGPAAINKKVNLRADLCGADLNSINLQGATLENADLRNTNLQNADLREADLSNANLQGADLREAILWEADLSNAILQNADLRKANIYAANLENTTLFMANLYKANLIDTILRKADLEAANLKFANLGKANLQRARLTGANFENAKLAQADLSNANLQGADLRNADLSNAILENADLSGSKLQNAVMVKTNLKNAILKDADLRETNLKETELIDATLENANLQRAGLDGTYLKGAKFKKAKLAGAIFEPEPTGSPPNFFDLVSAYQLEELTYKSLPLSLMNLREKLKQAGSQKIERQITYAVEKTRTRREWNSGLAGKIEASFRYIFFEATCGYGMFPGLLLELLLTFILLFSFFYAIAVKQASKQHGIWCIYKTRDKEKKFLVKLFSPKNRKASFFYWIRLLWVGFRFSLLSAFQIGWRELNIGNWIVRLQFRNYTLAATGWVRLVSGLQSLISLYLLAMWVLTYFGRPFK